MRINQLVPVSTSKPKRPLRALLYAATLLIAGGAIGAVVVGPTLGQGPGRDGPRWQHGWNDGRQDDAADRDRGPRGFGMRERDEGSRMGWRDRDGPRRNWGGGERMGGARDFGGGMLFPGAIERRVNRVLGAVDASSEQRQKVRAIIEAAGNDLYPVRQQRIDNRKQIAAALAAPSIDRGKIEQLRQERLKLDDSASKRLTDAITDAAEVLTPAQRAELAKRMERRRG